MLPSLREHCSKFKITFDGVGELFRALVAADLGRGVHVGKVNRDARSHGRQVVQGQAGHQRVLLDEQSQGLPDTASGTSDHHFEVPLKNHISMKFLFALLIMILPSLTYFFFIFLQCNLT